MVEQKEQAPIEERQSLMGMTLGVIGLPFAAVGLFAGAILAQSFTVTEGFKVILVATTILVGYTVLIGIIGAKSGRGTSSLLKGCFGTNGAKAVSLVITGMALCWYAVQTGYFAKLVDARFIEWGFSSHETLIAIVGGMLMFILPCFGFKGLQFANMIGIASFGVVFMIADWQICRSIDLHAVQPEGGMSFVDAVSALLGTWFVGATLNADKTRQARNALDATLANLTTFFGHIFIFGSGFLLGLMAGDGNLVSTLGMLSFGWAATLLLMWDKFNINNLNLFFASENLMDAFGLRPEIEEEEKKMKWKLVIPCGVVGTALAGIGFVEYFGPFLGVLGIITPPIGGVLIAHHLLGVPLLRLEATRPKVSLAGATAGIAGVALAAIIPVGIPAVNGLLITLLTYLLFAVTMRAGQV